MHASYGLGKWAGYMDAIADVAKVIHEKKIVTSCDLLEMAEAMMCEDEVEN